MATDREVSCELRPAAVARAVLRDSTGAFVPIPPLTQKGQALSDAAFEGDAAKIVCMTSLSTPPASTPRRPSLSRLPSPLVQAALLASGIPSDSRDKVCHAHQLL